MDGGVINQAAAHPPGGIRLGLGLAEPPGRIGGGVGGTGVGDDCSRPGVADRDQDRRVVVVQVAVHVAVNLLDDAAVSSSRSA